MFYTPILFSPPLHNSFTATFLLLPRLLLPLPQQLPCSYPSRLYSLAGTIRAEAAAQDPIHFPSTTIRERKEEQRQQEKGGQGKQDAEVTGDLLTLLLQCAEVVSADNLEETNMMLLEFSLVATLFGTSAQRVTAYFSEAVSARIVSSCVGKNAAQPTVPHAKKLASAFQVFNGISPFIKFSHFTANQTNSSAFPKFSVRRGRSCFCLRGDIGRGRQQGR